MLVGVPGSQYSCHGRVSDDLRSTRTTWREKCRDRYLRARVNARDVAADFDHHASLSHRPKAAKGVSDVLL